MNYTNNAYLLFYIYYYITYVEFIQYYIIFPAARSGVVVQRRWGDAASPGKAFYSSRPGCRQSGVRLIHFFRH